MKKIIRNIIIIFLLLCVAWSVTVIIDYTRSKDLKEPLFAISTAKDQNGNGYYKCIGYEVKSVAKAFNGKDYIMYDMQFSLFGRGMGGKKSLFDNYRHNIGLMGSDKEKVLSYLEALEYVTPTVSGNQETYTEYVNGNDVKVMNMTLYNGIVAGFQYEYHNLEAAYNFAKYLRKDLELTFGKKTTYPGMIQTNKDYFDNIKDVSELKSQYTYYEDWTESFSDKKKENIDIMLSGKKYSRIDVRLELFVVHENKAFVSFRYVALP